MSHTNGHAVPFDETIMRLVDNYKNLPRPERTVGYNTSAKRSPSPAYSSGSSELTPAKKFKQECQIVCTGSPREYRRLKCDLLESRNYTKELENQLTQMRGIRREEQIVYDHETKRWKSQAERDRKSLSELENKLEEYRKREQSTKTELNDAKAHFSKMKAEKEKRIQEIEAQLNNMKEEVHQQSTDENASNLKLQRQVEELQIIYNAAKEEIDAHKKFVQDLTSKLSEKTSLENELEKRTQDLNKALLQIRKIEFNKELYLEYQQQAKSQQQKLTNYEILLRENAQLREENCNLKQDVHNKLLLEEEVHDIKGRLQKFQDVEKKLNTLMVTNTQTEMQLEEFRTLARSICEKSHADASLPHLLRSVVERLQQQEIALTTDKIQLDSSLATTTHQAMIAQNELEKSRAHIAAMERDFKQAKVQMMRMQRKLQLVLGERDSYRKQLDSYEKDLTICVNPASVANPGAAQLEFQFERIKNLEHTVAEYRDVVEKLEMDLKSVEGAVVTDNVPVRAEQLARLQAELVKLRNDNDLLRQRKDKLEIQLEEYLVGSDVAHGRIVHLATNPLANIMKQRETEKQRLEDEVVSLKRKVKKLEDGLEATRLGDVTIDHREVQALKEKLAAAESNHMRMKEVFKKSMQDTRDVTYMLFGYKLDMPQQSQYKITSMYAEKTDDVLCFHLSKEGAFNLMENEYSSSLKGMVELHLRHQGSIPVFLSSLTLELFNSQSMTKPFEIDDDDVDDDDDDDDEDDDNDDDDDDDLDNDNEDMDDDEEDVADEEISDD